MSAATRQLSESAGHVAETRVTVLRPAPVRRPIVHTEPRSKITVVMDETHVLYLDAVSLCIRARHPGRTVSRAELVRAFIEFMAQSGIDFSEFKNAEEITEYLVAYLRANMSRARLPLLESSLVQLVTRGKR